jgi:hypothetical protein
MTKNGSGQRFDGLLMKDSIMSRVKRIEGLRDGCFSYDRLEERADYIEDCFNSAGFFVERDSFDFSGKVYRNIIATTSGIREMEEWTLVCAHYDAVCISPGADDNASGVAVMLEIAKHLGPRRGLKFVAFTIEEPQQTGATFLIGSRHFVKKMKSEGQRYRAVYNLESVGYVNKEEGSQYRPPFVKSPRRGDFIAVVGNARSVSLMERFERSASLHVPELNVFTFKTPLNGRLLPESRFSDHAPFWDAGYPAVMITDTAMLRNPNYHTEFDTSDTLSPEFMAQVAQTLIHTVEEELHEQSSKEQPSPSLY